MGHLKDLILLFKEFQSLVPLKAKERCPVHRRRKGISKASDDRVCVFFSSRASNKGLFPKNPAQSITLRVLQSMPTKDGHQD